MASERLLLDNPEREIVRELQTTTVDGCNSNDQDNTISPEEKSARTTSKRNLQPWGWEILTWAIGTAAVVAILVLLAYFNGKPLDSWHSRLTPNAIISTLSQVAQSALMVAVASCIGQQQWVWFKQNRKLDDMKTFDDASRGPAGSILVLLRHPFR